MYYRQVFKIHQNDKSIYPWALFFRVFFFQNTVLWLHTKENLRKFEFFSKLSCGTLNYVLLESGRSLLLANKSELKSKEKGYKMTA